MSRITYDIAAMERIYDFEARERQLNALLERCRNCTEYGREQSIIIRDPAALRGALAEIEASFGSNLQAEKALKAYRNVLTHMDRNIPVDFFGAYVYPRSAPPAAPRVPAVAASVRRRTRAALAPRPDASIPRNMKPATAAETEPRKTNSAKRGQKERTVEAGAGALFQAVASMEVGLAGKDAALTELQEVCARLESGPAEEVMTRLTLELPDLQSIVERHGLSPRLVSAVETTLRIQNGL